MIARQLLDYGAHPDPDNPVVDTSTIRNNCFLPGSFSRVNRLESFTVQNYKDAFRTLTHKDLAQSLYVKVGYHERGDPDLRGRRSCATA